MLPVPDTYNIARYAVDLVAALGSTHVFTLTGGMAMHLNRAVAQHPTLKAVYCQHEQACVAAAEGYAKAANFRLAGFAVVTAGPGASNAVTSLISAYGDSTPMIVLAGQIKTADIDSFGTRTHGIQEIKSRELISPCVKKFVRLEAQQFRQQLLGACLEAFSGRPGPVFIEIPLDVQGLPIETSVDEVQKAAQTILRRVRQRVNQGAGTGELSQALGELLKAKRPLLYVGNGVRITGQESVVLEFAEQHQIPMVFSWLSFDMVPGNHPLNFGCPGGLAPIYSNQLLCDADVIIFLGARLDLGTTAFQRGFFGSQANRWIIDVDSAELAKFSGMPNTGTIEADLRDLPFAISNLQNQAACADPRWFSEVSVMRESYMIEERQRLSSKKFTVYGVGRVLSEVSASKVFVSASSGYAEETFTRFFSPKLNTRFFNGAALGAMGMGLPNAIGAAFATELPVMCMEADGGLMLNIQELATLSHYRPPGYVLFILNNGGYESIRSSQKRHFGKVYGADAESGLFLPDFKDIAAAFKLNYVRIDNEEALESFVDNLNSSAPPVIADLYVEKFEYRGPSVKTVIDAQGRLSTSSLKEISW
ncbi:thiamine pyrophosphate-binding protein [beta proteobacterium MWH-UniP1]